MLNDNILTARDGYIYTNGETYAHIIRLGVNDSADNWYEITEEEYNKIINSESLEEAAEDSGGE